MRDVALFNVWSSNKKCSSARCNSAASFVCRDAGVLGIETVSLIQTLKRFFLHIIILTTLTINASKYMFSRRILAGTNILAEFLFLSKLLCFVYMYLLEPIFARA
jgi:hypothetical protein